MTRAIDPGLAIPIDHDALMVEDDTVVAVLPSYPVDSEAAQFLERWPSPYVFSVPNGGIYHIDYTGDVTAFSAEGDYGFQLDGAINSGEVTARIEIMTAAWDDFHWIGPDDSQIHTFTEGNTIGLGWVVHDKDSAEEDNGGKSDGGWGINPNIQMWFDCVNCSDFLCDGRNGAPW